MFRVKHPEIGGEKPIGSNERNFFSGWLPAVFDVFVVRIFAVWLQQLSGALNLAGRITAVAELSALALLRAGLIAVGGPVRHKLSDDLTGSTETATIRCAF